MMTEKKYVLTRRDFLRTGSCVAVGSMIGLPLLGRAAAGSISNSRVILIRHDGVVGADGSVRPQILAGMLDAAVASLFQVNDPAEAWRRIVKPGDTVGIKTNAWGPLPTPPALEEAVKNRVVAAGVRPENLAADDRGIRSNPVFEKATVLINMRPLRTHHWSGLGTLLKNYIMFVPSPWAYHGNACESLGSIWNKPEIRGKTRLNVLVMLTPLFHGIGPHHFSKSYVWTYGGLIVSGDPVAADATGARIIQAKRNRFFGEERPISPPPRHIDAADATYGVGNSRPEKIELVKIGWDQDIFI
jgi:hypothetical protein